MYFADPREPVASAKPTPNESAAEGGHDAARFAQEARSARPGIRSALAVLLGADFENQAAACAEMCGWDLSRFQSLLTQAGCDLNADDAYTVELLFAAATTRNCQISFSLFSQRRSQKSDMAALVDEDLRWRSRSLRAGGRGQCVQRISGDVTARECARRARALPHGMHSLSAGGKEWDRGAPPESSCRCERPWPTWPGP